MFLHYWTILINLKKNFLQQWKYEDLQEVLKFPILELEERNFKKELLDF